jgi:hypothetical protein
VRLAEKRLADDADAGALRRGFDRGAQPGAAGADDENVVVVNRMRQNSLTSCQMPIAHIRT